MFAVRLAAFVKEDQESARRLTQSIAQTQGPGEIWQRAVDRGEVDPNRLTPRIRSLPFDLLSTELARTFRPVPGAVIEEIIDTVVLPLVAARCETCSDEGSP